VYLCYFDDSGSDSTSPICVFGGIVVSGEDFGHAEAWSHVAVEHLGLDESFEEFKASDLYFGQRAFESIDKTKRREAFLVLLNALTVHGCPFIYAAIDKEQLQTVPLFGSAHPVDVAFQMCLGQLEQWARSRHDHRDGVLTVAYEDMCLVIADECDGNLKRQMLATFRRKRTKRRIQGGEDVTHRLFHIHDSMYFGASRDSVGLQMADAANWCMRRYLCGEPLDDGLVDQLKKVSVCATVEPEWTQHRHIFKNHLDVK
jgi:hypothetical protein